MSTAVDEATVLAAVQAHASVLAGTHTDPDVVRELEALEQRIAAAVLRKRPERDPNQAFDQTLTVGARLADRVVAVMGSWRFIVVQSAILIVWIVANVAELLWRPWDPYPFILLNLMLSFQAAYSAPVIMMSQNRKAAKDRLEADLDLHTNLRAEALIEELHVSMDELRLRQWSELLSIQQRQTDLLQRAIARLEGVAEATTPTRQ
jgi:uncharacterized membrane protein